MSAANRTAAMSFRMTEEDMAKLKRIAELEDRPFASVIRVALREYLERQEKKST